VTHPTLPHSCFSAATLRAHKEAEQKVIAAAKALRDVPFSGSPIDAAAWTVAFDNLDIAVAALRAVEGDV
jgi:hypothetical protein